MAARIKTLLDALGNKLYPKTKTNAVYDSNNNTLDTILTAKQNATDNSLETDSKTIVGAINELKTKVEEVDGGGTAKSAINPTAAEISAFENGAIWIETT